MFSDHVIGNDLVVLASKTDHPESVWNEVIHSSAYERGVSNLPPGSVMVDVGAHIGLAALHFARTGTGRPDLRLRTHVGFLPLSRGELRTARAGRAHGQLRHRFVEP
ncbi:hypothetical protein SD37_11015 [Amycolatopsis orientalis]|uniref:Methyltransferase FkbM domain-containing protein n=1 Tax=Amycolatopsis orientalis TaxID=31958 RepID=A0A193BVB7_AMYOR|nr:hypothetical protein SD37_11015 [Amycolatopsis orientalis]